MKYLIFFTILYSSFSLNATETLIQGNAFSYRGKEIEIHRYLDLFTFKSEAIVSQEILEDGSFKFNVDVVQTGIFLIKIGKIHAHLFVVPGDQYTIVIPEPSEIDRFNPAKDIFLQPEIFESTDRLNYHITKLEQTINSFFIDNTTDSYSLRSGGGIKSLADSLMPKLKEQFADVESPYFQEHFHFRLAEFELSTRHSRQSVYEKYFKENKPAFNQLSFANAFKTFYNDYMSPRSTMHFSDSVESSINQINLERLSAYLSTDPYLTQPEYLNLLMVTELYELGREKIYPASTIITLLDQIQVKANSSELSALIMDSKAILLRLAPGTRAPDFVFADVVGNLYRISEYEGSHIYIQFFDEFDAETVRQMSLMKVLREGYGSDIAMFSFSTSESLKRLRDIPSKHDFDWFFGKVGTPDKVIDDYELRAMPEYFFLDEELKFICNPTPPPGGRIERMFAKVWNKKHPNKMMPFKLQPPTVEEPDMGAASEK
jgi:archaellum component FlaF (FlaF/FlaG flagellin family)